MNSDLIIVATILFLVIVLPIWIVMHYATIWRRERTQSQHEESSNRDLQAQAERMEERLDAIESILDSDAPDWRTRS